VINLFKRIFGSPEIIKESLSLIRDAGDVIWYTEEEKAQDAARRGAQSDKLLIDWMESSKGQNLARRMLAVMLASVWMLMFLLSTLGDMIAPFLALHSDPAFMDAWRESSDAIDGRTEQMTGAMMLILGFYFAAPHLGKVIDGAMNKFSGVNK
tara:strand:- start:6928 stop:7386 length:459 start_codon:yes stop_codon:yes gene_type:complete